LSAVPCCSSSSSSSSSSSEDDDDVEEPEPEPEPGRERPVSSRWRSFGRTERDVEGLVLVLCFFFGDGDLLTDWYLGLEGGGVWVLVCDDEKEEEEGTNRGRLSSSSPEACVVAE